MDRRDLQLNALLGITQAINNNVVEEDLFRIYRFTLLGDLKVTKMALFVHADERWLHQVDFGTDINWVDYSLDNRFDDLKESMLLQEDPEFSCFKWVIPILHKEQLLALLFVGDVEDATFIKALTNIIIVAIENKRLARQRQQQEAYEKELEIAKKVQNFLFPKSLPNAPELKIEATYLPHHDVGGDYYDYIRLDLDKFLLCIADVSGKGVPAALLMSNFQATLHILARRTHDLEEIVNELNASTLHSGNGENFITFFAAIFDGASGDLSYVNCGHNPMYLIEGEKLRQLDKGTTILGIFNPLPFLEIEVIQELREFTFFGFTDGLTETFNEAGDDFGEERLERLIRGVDDLKFLHSSILQALDDFRGKARYHDDITMLSCKVVRK